MKKINLVLLLFLYLVIKTNAQVPYELWGITCYGGDNIPNGGGWGVIFQTNTAINSHTVQYTFGENTGSRPGIQKLCEASNGKLYGTTNLGGSYNYNFGVIFEYDTLNGIYTKKFVFTGGIAGESPSGGLVRAPNNKLYGMTSYGGTFFKGTLFEYDPATNVFTKKIDFDGANIGTYPAGSLVLHPNGKLYGVTSNGGVNNFGVLFEYNVSANTLTKKFDFTGAGTGRYPQSGLMCSSNSKLYGQCNQGGTSDQGTLYEYNLSNNTVTKKYDFNSTAGTYPQEEIMETASGKLYGTTIYGGASGQGTLYEFDTTANIFTKKIDFNGTNGSSCVSTLFPVTANLLYGTTYSGGANNTGIIFEYNTTTGILTKKIDFNNPTTGGNPYSSLMKASNGRIYGLTSLGGYNSCGTLYEYYPNTNTITKKIDLTAAYNGATAWGSLTKGPNGKLYGMTYGGGINKAGVIFEIDPVTYAFAKKHDFLPATGGYGYGSLLLANNNKFYGLTEDGGANNNGVLFEYDPATNTYTKKIDFNNVITGRRPLASLIQAANGKLYGTCGYGGVNDKGTIFEYDINLNTCTKKFDFNGTGNGENPLCQLVQAGNVKLYGTTWKGGVNSVGVIFEYDITLNICTKKYDFNNTGNGGSPYGRLIQASNNKLYGMTPNGGTSNLGVLYEYDYTAGVFTKKLDIGVNCFGELMEASNGKIYGMTRNGGTFNKGTIFEYDYNTNTATTKIDFNGVKGEFSNYGHLTEVCQAITIPGQPIATSVCQSNSVVISTTVTGTNLSYQWFFNNAAIASATTAALTISNFSTNDAGNYFCAISNGCRNLNTDTIPVSLITVPTLTVSGTSTICAGDSTQLFASGALNYTWSSGAITNSVILTPSTTSVYSVSGSNACGTGSSVITVTVFSLPVISLANGSICAGQSYTINPNGAFTYSFSGGSSVVSPASTTSYSVTGTSTAGCVSPAPGVITITVNPTPTISVNSGLICAGQSFTINPSGANTYTITGNNFNVSPSTTTSYSVNGTDLNGCTSATPATSTVTVNNLPNINITSSDSLVCINQSATLTASGANTYTWSNSSTGISMVVSPSVTTTYSITGTDLNGCENSYTITQSVSPCTGVSSTKYDNDMKVYPNPTNGIIMIEGNDNLNVEIYNSIGELILFTHITQNKTALDLSAFARGIYYVLLKDGISRGYHIIKE